LSLQSCEHIAVIQQYQWRARGTLQRRADQLLRCCKLALLRLDNPEQIERINARRVPGEDGLVGLLGLGDAPGAMMLQGHAKLIIYGLLQAPAPTGAPARARLLVS
jgi:hypothetical protein